MSGGAGREKAWLGGDARCGTGRGWAARPTRLPACDHLLLRVVKRNLAEGVAVRARSVGRTLGCHGRVNNYVYDGARAARLVQLTAHWADTHRDVQTLQPSAAAPTFIRDQMQ